MSSSGPGPGAPVSLVPCGAGSSSDPWGSMGDAERRPANWLAQSGPGVVRLGSVWGPAPSIYTASCWGLGSRKCACGLGLATDHVPGALGEEAVGRGHSSPRGLAREAESCSPSWARTPQSGGPSPSREAAYCTLRARGLHVWAGEDAELSLALEPPPPCCQKVSGQPRESSSRC